MYIDDYKRWLSADLEDPALTDELRKIEGQDNEIKERFAVALKFGTAGLRGILGAGSNRMNIYVVRQATQGLANWVKTQGGSQLVAISYDSRINSDVFARNAACVLAANGIRVRIYDALMPVPALSFATRYYKANAGIMITASHNPAKYNGYKVYGADGCQVTVEAAAEILSEIEKLDLFDGVKRADFDACLHDGRIRLISDEVLAAFLEAVKAQSVLFGEEARKDIAIVYSPLNGTGYVPVTRALKELGYARVTVVEEQRLPDGHFPTCPYPNPEIREAMALGITYAGRLGADLLMATDPDCDRVGVAVRDRSGGYVLLSGNETGLLLLDYLCAQRMKHGAMPADPVLIKTIVTTDMAERIAAHYGVRTVNVLTGFKFIGEQIGCLEAQGRLNSYVFGFEESYGYLSGPYVRDKDGVGAACLICEMFSYYAARGVSLLDRLEQLYADYGYCLNTLHSYAFDGSAGFARMQAVMQGLRGGVASFGTRKVLRVLDYAEGLDGLPKSDVLKFILEGGCTLVVRPSGTEPKLKLYLSVSAQSREAAQEAEAELLRSAEALLG